MTTIHDLATALDGVVVPHHGDDRVLTAAGLVYCGPTGKVRLQRNDGHVVDLGMHSDGPAVIAAEYRARLAVQP